MRVETAIVIVGALVAAAMGFMWEMGRRTGSAIERTAMCRQWAGKSAIVYRGECMVPTGDDGLRPARRDE